MWRTPPPPYSNPKLSHNSSCGTEYPSLKTNLLKLVPGLTWIFLLDPGSFGGIFGGIIFLTLKYTPKWPN